MGGPAMIDGVVYPVTDNFLRCKFVVLNKEYCSSENYFQCMKARNEEDHEKLRRCGPGMDVWVASRKIHLRQDWEKVKVRVMHQANLNKFAQNPEFMKTLVGTKGPIHMGNGFWPRWNARILTRIRAELRQNGEEDDMTIKTVE